MAGSELHCHRDHRARDAHDLRHRMEEPHFDYGCAVRDGSTTDWQCDGEGHLTRFIK